MCQLQIVLIRPIIPNALHYWRFWPKRLPIKKENFLPNMQLPAQSFTHFIRNKIPTASSLTQANFKTRQGISYARAVLLQPSPQPQQTERPLNPKLSNRRYQSNRPGSVLKNYIACPEILHEMHKQSRKSPSNNTHSERIK